MTYYEILIWIQENLVEVVQYFNEKFKMTYYDEDGIIRVIECDDIISGVLQINECDLVN